MQRENKMHNLPIVPGLYWATDLYGSAEWDFIVEISGKAPLLRCTPLYYREHKPPSDVRKCPEKLYYGPKIEVPIRDPLRIIPRQ